MSGRQDQPETHQPANEELEEVVRTDATPDRLAAAVLKAGAARQEPKKN